MALGFKAHVKLISAKFGVFNSILLGCCSNNKQDSGGWFPQSDQSCQNSIFLLQINTFPKLKNNNHSSLRSSFGFWLNAGLIFFFFNSSHSCRRRHRSTYLAESPGAERSAAVIAQSFRLSVSAALNLITGGKSQNSDSWENHNYWLL